MARAEEDDNGSGGSTSCDGGELALWESSLSGYGEPRRPWRALRATARAREAVVGSQPLRAEEGATELLLGHCAVEGVAEPGLDGHQIGLQVSLSANPLTGKISG
uniref:Uncharacterized protein n=1 Tax=Oryza sativa subsp. japonica TaxID=39947 RepID=Q5ZA69_ORYSJ|nr:hypothetical protein [Oryza sativa Japonica Group]